MLGAGAISSSQYRPSARSAQMKRMPPVTERPSTAHPRPPAAIIIHGAHKTTSVQACKIASFTIFSIPRRRWRFLSYGITDEMQQRLRIEWKAWRCPARVPTCSTVCEAVNRFIGKKDDILIQQNKTSETARKVQDCKRSLCRKI
jgi:hypothetical protein